MEQAISSKNDEDDVVECSICLEPIPCDRGRVQSMCIQCALEHGHELGVDPATRQRIATCPHCDEVLTAMNLCLHYDHCAAFPTTLAAIRAPRDFTWLGRQHHANKQSRDEWQAVVYQRQCAKGWEQISGQ